MAEAAKIISESAMKISEAKISEMAYRGSESGGSGEEIEISNNQRHQQQWRKSAAAKIGGGNQR